jgi:hypothetical protein
MLYILSGDFCFSSIATTIKAAKVAAEARPPEMVSG